jgi:hypothetical protein
LSEENSDEKIISLIEEIKPESVEQLIYHITERQLLPEKNILRKIAKLEGQGRIRLVQPKKKIPDRVQEYLWSGEAVWFWLIIFLSSISSISVLSLSTEPLVYLRYVLGVPLILFLPGYSLMKALFPEKEKDLFENIIFSVGLSLALTPLVGMLLNYTPWGLTVWSVTLSIFILITTLTFTGVFREYNYLKKT